MDYESIGNFLTSAPVIGAALIAGSSALSIFVYKHYFSSRRIETAGYRKEVRLAKEATRQSKETTKRLEVTARQEELALKFRITDNGVTLKNMEYTENEKKHTREKEIIGLKAAKKQELSRMELEYQERIAAKMAELRGVFVGYEKMHAIVAATAGQMKTLEEFINMIVKNPVEETSERDSQFTEILKGPKGDVFPQFTEPLE